jgi:hypothetical protein
MALMHRSKDIYQYCGLEILDQVSNVGQENLEYKNIDILAFV